MLSCWIGNASGNASGNESGNGIKLGRIKKDASFKRFFNVSIVLKLYWKWQWKCKCKWKWDVLQKLRRNLERCFTRWILHQMKFLHCDKPQVEMEVKYLAMVGFKNVPYLTIFEIESDAFSVGTSQVEGGCPYEKKKRKSTINSGAMICKRNRWRRATRAVR